MKNNPPRGKRSKLKEKKSKSELSGLCPYVDFRDPPIQPENIKRDEKIKVEYIKDESDYLEQKEESAPVAPVVVAVPPFRKTVVKTNDQPKKNCPCRKVKRKVDDETEWHENLDFQFPSPIPPRENKLCSTCYKIENIKNPISNRHLLDDFPKSPPRFFRPDAIPQLQKFYWEIGDVTYLKFSFQEPCQTVSHSNVGGFKIWRYWCQKFSMDCTVGDLVLFIENNIEVPFPEYRLISRCKKVDEEILPTDWYKTLRCLLLYPKATILILPRQPSCYLATFYLMRTWLIFLAPLLFIISVIKCAFRSMLQSWNRGTL